MPTSAIAGVPGAARTGAAIGESEREWRRWLSRRGESRRTRLAGSSARLAARSKGPPPGWWRNASTLSGNAACPFIRCRRGNAKCSYRSRASDRISSVFRKWRRCERDGHFTGRVGRRAVPTARARERTCEEGMYQLTCRVLPPDGLNSCYTRLGPGGCRAGVRLIAGCWGKRKPRMLEVWRGEVHGQSQCRIGRTLDRLTAVACGPAGSINRSPRRGCSWPRRHFREDDARLGC